MKRLLFTLGLFMVSCNALYAMSDNSTDEENCYYLTELNLKNSKIRSGLEKTIASLPDNSKGEIYLFTIRKSNNKHFVIVQNWSMENLEGSIYSYMGGYKQRPNSWYVVVYDNKWSLSKLKKIFKATNKKTCIPKFSKHVDIDSRFYILDDINTYFLGEIKDGKIIMNKMIIKNKVYR